MVRSSSTGASCFAAAVKGKKMKVRNLIQELEKMPQGAEVVWQQSGEHPSVVVATVKNASHIPLGDASPLPMELAIATGANGLVVVLS